MNARLRRQTLLWTCPDCGEVEDRILEVSYEGRVHARWFQDGHFGLKNRSDAEIEFELCQLLGVEFQALERLREARVRSRTPHVALDHAFVTMLREEGHVLTMEEETFQSLGVHPATYEAK